MMARLNLLTNCLVLCMTAMDAMQIQVNHSQPVLEPEGGYLVKSSADPYDSAMTLVSGLWQLAEPEHDTERTELLNNISDTTTFKIMDSMTETYLQGADVDQMLQLRMQPMQCNLTEIQSLFKMLNVGAGKVKSPKAPVPEHAAVSNSTILAKAGGAPKVPDVQKLLSNARPEVQKACGASMVGFVGPNWDNIGGCLAAIMHTRGQCSKCFTNTFQAMIGASFFDMPSSCSAKCMAEKNGPLKKMGPECEACMHSNLGDMMTCIGIDMQAFELGGRPHFGQASSLVPYQTITALVTLVTLGLAGMF